MNMLALELAVNMDVNEQWWEAGLLWNIGFFYNGNMFDGICMKLLLSKLAAVLCILFVGGYITATEFVELLPYVKPAKEQFREEKLGIQVVAWKVSDDVLRQSFGKKTKYLGHVATICMEIFNNSPVALNLDNSVVYGERLPFCVIREIADTRPFLHSPSAIGVIGFLSFMLVSVLFKNKIDAFFEYIESDTTEQGVPMVLAMFPFREYVDRIMFYAGLASVIVPSCCMCLYLYRDYHGIDRIKHVFELQGYLAPYSSQNLIMFFDRDFIDNYKGFKLSVDNSLGKEVDFFIKLMH